MKYHIPKEIFQKLPHLIIHLENITKPLELTILPFFFFFTHKQKIKSLSLTFILSPHRHHHPLSFISFTSSFSLFSFSLLYVDVTKMEKREMVAIVDETVMTVDENEDGMVMSDTVMTVMMVDENKDGGWR